MVVFLLDSKVHFDYLYFIINPKTQKMLNQNEFLEIAQTVGLFTKISEMKEIAKIMAEERRAENERLAEKARMEFERMKFSNFEISVMYWNPAHTSAKPDIFEVEWIENAMMIFERYRKIGFRLNLKSISITENGKLVKKVNFKY